MLCVLGALVFASILNSSEQTPSIPENGVLHLTLSDYIPDHTNNLETNSFSLKEEKTLGLYEMIKTLENASKDDNIKGIFIEADVVMTNGVSSVQILRDAILKFKSSGKFVMSYAKAYSQGGYYLASASDKVYVNPFGLIDLKGFAAQVPFYKDMLDKVGVDMQVFYAGQFKGATEPYRFMKMSPQNRYQVRVYLEEIYNSFLDDVSKSREMDKASLKEIVDTYAASNPAEAASLKIIDKAAYRDEALGWMTEQLGLDKSKKINFISLRDYNKANPPRSGSYAIKDRIAVVYAEGAIVDGRGSNGSVGDKEYVKIFNDLAEDDKVKAVVLHVNSPGGSALSAENMHHALKNLKNTGKPLVISMGDYAASAGYYISALADHIIATENTLTGSIGVFLVMPNAKTLLNDRLGINFDTVSTGEFSAGLTPLYDLTKKEKQWLQLRTQSMYQSFLERVASGRDMDVKEVDKIAQGRVWTGPQAVQNGLVDEIGNLDVAIKKAAELAELSEYRTKTYPYIKPQLEQLIEELTGEAETDIQFKYLLKSQWPEVLPYYHHLKAIRETKGLQARLPFFIPFE